MILSLCILRFATLMVVMLDPLLRHSSFLHHVCELFRENRTYDVVVGMVDALVSLWLAHMLYAAWEDFSELKHSVCCCTITKKQAASYVCLDVIVTLVDLTMAATTTYSQAALLPLRIFSACHCVVTFALWLVIGRVLSKILDTECKAREYKASECKDAAIKLGRPPWQSPWLLWVDDEVLYLC